MQRPRVVNLRNERFDVYIGRGSQWGNPLRIGVDGSRSVVIQKYREYALGMFSHESLRTLAGKTLGCYCKPLACHGDVLADMVEAL